MMAIQLRAMIALAFLSTASAQETAESGFQGPLLDTSQPKQGASKPATLGVVCEKLDSIEQRTARLVIEQDETRSTARATLARLREAFPEQAAKVVEASESSEARTVAASPEG